MHFLWLIYGCVSYSVRSDTVQQIFKAVLSAIYELNNLLYTRNLLVKQKCNYQFKSSTICKCRCLLFD